MESFDYRANRKMCNEAHAISPRFCHCFVTVFLYYLFQSPCNPMWMLSRGCQLKWAWMYLDTDYDSYFLWVSFFHGLKGKHAILMWLKILLERESSLLNIVLWKGMSWCFYGWKLLLQRVLKYVKWHAV